MAFLLDVALPFVFVLAVVYGGLELSKVMQNKGVKGLISIVIAFFAVSTPTLAGFLKQVLPYAAVGFIIIFFLGFLFSFAKGKEGEKKDYVLLLIEAALIFVALGAFGTDLQKLLPSNSPVSAENIMWGLGIALILIILVAAYRHLGEEGKT